MTDRLTDRLTERLTDEQVAALARDGCFVDETMRRSTIPGSGTWKALAAEVQQARSRRCDACSHWYGRHKDDVTWRCPIRDQPTLPEYFCASFEPVGPTA